MTEKEEGAPDTSGEPLITVHRKKKTAPGPRAGQEMPPGAPGMPSGRAGEPPGTSDTQPAAAPEKAAEGLSRNIPLVAADSHPFNSALMGAWVKYLEHYPTKGDSWRKMNADVLLDLVNKEFAEFKGPIASLRVITDASQAYHALTEAISEIDDLVCVLVLLRQRLIMGRDNIETEEDHR